MLQIGRMDRRVTLQTQSATVDAIGQPLDTWVDVVTVWADVRHLNGVESIKGGAPSSSVQASIRIRYRSGVDAGMRVLDGAAVYNVLAVLPHGREYIDLVCEVINADS